MEVLRQANFRLLFAARTISFFGPSGAGYWRLALVPTLAECERAAEILDREL